MIKKYSADDIVLTKSIQSPIHSADLTEVGFRNNLQSATDSALEFAKTLITNQLLGELKYLVFLGSSCDEFDLEEAELILDGDQQYVRLNNLDEVRKILWRSGLVPEWVNVYVSSEDADNTNIKFDYCARFTEDPKIVYHIEKGIAPFHVLGPPVPDGFDLSSGVKYKI